MVNQVLIAKTPEEINFWHLCSLRGALRLEKLGMKRRGTSALSVAKRELKLSKRASYEDAITAVQAEIDRQTAERAHG